MNKMSMLLAIVMFSILQIEAQNFSQEFGKIAKDELELSVYSKDKEAEALVLFDKARSYFSETHNNYEVIFERSTRVKILKESGLKWAEVEIPIYQEGGIFEQVYDIEAYTYNYNNGILNKIPLDLTSVYTEKLNNLWSLKKFALPGVKEGSVIEYRYKIRSEYKFNLRDWDFQWRIPVVYSEYRVDMIPFYEFTWLLQGAKKFDVQAKYEDTGSPRRLPGSTGYQENTYYDLVNVFGMKDLPAFRDEEFITSVNDYIIKIDFQLSKVNYLTGGSQQIMTTWTEMNKEFLKNKDFGKYIDKSEKLAKKILDSKFISDKSEKGLFNYVINYMKLNFNWNNYYGKYASKSPKKFVDEKSGSCAELNLFAVGFLRSAGIEAYPVLVSTRGHGKIKYDYPYSHFFNYVVIYAKVDGKVVLTDVSQVLSMNDRIPANCINEKGLLIKKDDVQWVNLNASEASEQKVKLSLNVDKNLKVNGRIDRTFTEYEAFNYRMSFGKNPDEIAKKIQSEDLKIDRSSIDVQNPLDKEKPYVLNYNIEYKTDSINNKLYIHPFAKISPKENPLKQKYRTYPIDMVYPLKRSFVSELNIPENYELDYLPEGLEANNPLFELNYKSEQKDNKVIVSFDYFFKQAVYEARDYAKIKFYFDEIVKKGNELIVLKKKEADSTVAVN